MIDGSMRTKEESDQFEKINKLIHGKNTAGVPAEEQWKAPVEHNAPVYSPEEFRAQRETGVPDGIREMPLG